MTTKTTELWLSRDADGSYWASRQEPVLRIWGDSVAWVNDNGPIFPWEVPNSLPTVRKGTKRRIRVTVEVLR
jgi:hypothetical protein